MLSRDPTFIGEIVAVSGAALTVQLARSVSSGLSIINGQTYRIGQVGSFVRIPQGYQDLFGIISEVGATAAPQQIVDTTETGRWMTIELVGETIGSSFQRGVSQYPNIGDSVHLAVEKHLRQVYDVKEHGYIIIGNLSSAESIPAKIALDELLTRHSAVFGSTGSGKSTTIASLLRAITAIDDEGRIRYPSARILMLDIHGEYARPLTDVAQVFSIDPQAEEKHLFIPYWALDIDDLVDFLTGGVERNQRTAFLDKIYEMKRTSHERQGFAGIDGSSITVNTPLPFSLKQLWYDLIAYETMTFEGPARDQSTLQADGDPEALVRPRYKPHAMGAAGPFLNQQAFGIQRHLNLLRSRLLDRRYDFLLHPGPWEPGLSGRPRQDLDSLLHSWLGSVKPITILDLSGIPSSVLERLVGSILRIVYDALFWSREKTEGGIQRPLLVVMEEAHRYLASKRTSGTGLASQVVQRIAKEGRKYGIGAMVISQRPSEVNETILSQCGTVFALRLTNPTDRERVRGTLPDGLVGLLDVLPILRTGEAIVTGEAAKLPMRCRVQLPTEAHRPQSEDPKVSERWSLARRDEGYDRVVASWRAQNPLAVAQDVRILRQSVEDDVNVVTGSDRG
ncbi:MAG: ATP-binding protein [bacterium]|nr:ATP-binding protein [bacterium]